MARIPIASTKLPQDPTEQLAVLDHFLEEFLAALTNRGFKVARIEQSAGPSRPASPLQASELSGAAVKRLAALRERQVDSTFHLHLADDRGLLLLQLVRLGADRSVSLYAHGVSDDDAMSLDQLGNQLSDKKSSAEWC